MTIIPALKTPNADVSRGVKIISNDMTQNQIFFFN